MYLCMYMYTHTHTHTHIMQDMGRDAIIAINKADLVHPHVVRFVCIWFSPLVVGAQMKFFGFYVVDRFFSLFFSVNLSGAQMSLVCAPGSTNTACSQPGK